MSRYKVLVVFLTAVILIVSQGCSGNPAVRKAKYLESGKKYLDKGMYRDAAIQFSNALKIDPAFAEAHYQLALSYEQLGALSSAYIEFEKTIDLQKSNLNAQIALGNLMLAGRKTKDAGEKADFVLAADPNNVDAHKLKGNVLATQGDSVAGVAELSRAIELSPKRSDLYMNLGLMQLGQTKAADAEKAFKQAAELDPKSSGPPMALAGLYIQQQRLPEAEQQYLSALQKDPRNLQVRATLARFYLRQQKSQQAEQVVTDAMRVLPDSSQAAELVANYYSGTNNVDKAANTLKSFCEKHPKDVAGKKLYVQMLLSLNRVDEAAKLNDEILKANDKDVEALIVRGHILNQQNKTADAIDLFNRALKEDDNNAMAHYELGAAEQRMGDRDRAEQEFRKAVRLQPGLIPAQHALAQVAIAKGDVDLISSTADQLIKLQPLDATGYLLRADARANHRDIAGAMQDVQTAIRVAPNKPDSYTTMGRLLETQRKFDEAEKAYEQALDRDPNFTEAMRGLISVYAAQRHMDKALQRVDLQLQKVPQSASLYLLKGDLLSQTDKAKAMEAWKKAIDLDKKNVAPFGRLAQLQIEQGLLDDAAATTTKWEQVSPNDALAYFEQGIVEQRRGNSKNAEKLYEKALQIKPDMAIAANNLAYLLLQDGSNTDLALSMAQTAARLLPESPNASDTLGWAYYQKGTYQLAADQFQQAIKRIPSSALYHYHLGLALEKSKDFSGAKAEFVQVLKLDPAFSDANTVRQMLKEMS